MKECTSPCGEEKWNAEGHLDIVHTSNSSDNVNPENCASETVYYR